MWHVKQPRDQWNLPSNFKPVFHFCLGHNKGLQMSTRSGHTIACLLVMLFHTNIFHYICWSAFILHKQEWNSFLATVDPYTSVKYWCEIVPLLLQGCRSLFKGFSFLMLGYRGEQMETDILSSLIQHMYCNCFFWQCSITHAHCSCSATNVFKSNLMNF